MLERVFEELSFTAPDRSGESVVVDEKYVQTYLADLAGKADLSRYVL